MSDDLNNLTEQQISIAMAAIDKKYGRGTIFLLDSDDAVQWPAISTGAPTLDKALGIGGFPVGRIVEIFGPESCLSGDTKLNLYQKTKKGSFKKAKIHTISALYDTWFNTRHVGKFDYYIQSVNEYGIICYNKVIRPFFKDEQECFEITTDNGHRICATKNHKIKTGGKWVKVEDLNVGDRVYTPSGCMRSDNYPHIDNVTLMPSTYPNGVIRDAYNDITEALDSMSFVLDSRLVYEAVVLNKVSVIDFCDQIDTGDFTDLTFLEPTDHIGHYDGDSSNNSPKNLFLMKDVPRDTSIPHRNKLWNKKSYNKFVTQNARIVSVKSVGTKDTYDLSVQDPFNNYMAEGVLVHNSGKTTLALSVVAQAQADDSFCAYIDTEHALDPTYAERIGVQLDKLAISQPDYGEQAIDITEQIVSTGNFKVVVVDSVAALIPKAELEGDMESQHMGLQARLMSKAMRKLVSKANETKTLIIFINQLREKIGIVYGNPEVTPGGRALRYSASIRVDIRKMKDIKSKNGNGPSGVHTKTKIVKNKMAAPFKIAEFDILYGTGIDKIGCIVDMAIEAGYLSQAGSWIKYGEGLEGHDPGSVMAQGRDGAIAALKEDAELLELFAKKVGIK